MKKYVIEFFISEYKHSRHYTTEPISKQMLKETIKELRYNWEIEHIYEINKELTLDELKKEIE